jgi:hypothetical protein
MGHRKKVMGEIVEAAKVRRARTWSEVTKLLVWKMITGF